MNTIAERIKFAMKAKNKKQVDIVKDTGISKGAFSSYLSGQYNPKADKMELIQKPMNRKLPCFPTHRLTIAFISTMEYTTVTSRHLKKNW